jgi:hypothetical protein
MVAIIWRKHERLTAWKSQAMVGGMFECLAELHDQVTSATSLEKCRRLSRLSKPEPIVRTPVSK